MERKTRKKDFKCYKAHKIALTLYNMWIFADIAFFSRLKLQNIPLVVPPCGSCINYSVMSGLKGLDLQLFLYALKIP